MPTTLLMELYCSQLSIIDLVESIYSSLDKTSRTFYWQRLQGEIRVMICLSRFAETFQFVMISNPHSFMLNPQVRSTSSWRTLTSTWKRRRASSSLSSTSQSSSTTAQQPKHFFVVFTNFTNSIVGISTTTNWCRSRRR